MSSEDPLLDFDRLLSPVSEDRPSGESLQYSGLFDEIREARRADDVLEQGDWKRELKVADWDEAAALATDALLTKTKDLQVAAWLAEALTMLQGFAGARDGLKLMKGLHSQFWETCYPEIDEGDMEGRANVLSFLDRQVALSLRKAPLTRAPGMNFSWLEWNESRAFDIPESITGPLDADSQSRLSELKRQAVEENKTAGEDFRKAKGSTPKVFYEDASKALAQAWDEFQGLDRVMDEKFGRQTPGLGELKKAIEEVRRVVDGILKEKRALEPDAKAAGGAPAAAEEGGAEAGGAVVYRVAGPSGPIRSRGEALARLGEVAEFFRQTEPHSPVSYLVQRAITWGQMPLETWLADVIKDTGVLEGIKETLGIRPAGE
ncbi:MAG: type VI secretion system protein TssA [Holophagales bacterium]|jgi:type VI secretion system protein ImpA|nr:type VI secretion system protein TssA [Holophagales bacterium]